MHTRNHTHTHTDTHSLSLSHLYFFYLPMSVTGILSKLKNGDDKHAVFCWIKDFGSLQPCAQLVALDAFQALYRDNKVLQRMTELIKQELRESYEDLLQIQALNHEMKRQVRDEQRERDRLTASLASARHGQGGHDRSDASLASACSEAGASIKSISQQVAELREQHAAAKAEERSLKQALELAKERGKKVACSVRQAEVDLEKAKGRLDALGDDLLRAHRSVVETERWALTLRAKEAEAQEDAASTSRRLFSLEHELGTATKRAALMHWFCSYIDAMIRELLATFTNKFSAFEEACREMSAMTELCDGSLLSRPVAGVYARALMPSISEGAS